GLGYEYGKTYIKQAYNVCELVGKSLVYYYVPESEESKILNASENQGTFLRSPDTAESEVLSTPESEVNNSEVPSCSEPETSKSKALNISEPKIVDSEKSKEKCSKPKTQQRKVTKKFKTKTLPKKQLKPQVIYDSRIRNYNQSKFWNDNQQRFWNHRQPEAWRRNNNQNYKKSQNEHYYSKPRFSPKAHKSKPFRTNQRGPRSKWVPKSQIFYSSDLANRKDFVLPKVWMQVKWKGRRAYVPKLWFASRDEENYWAEYVRECKDYYHDD
ncbi:hypothetical protein A2U01_0022323, partial [Trifolium medium]|nr:hypothetical protein [Trifolium medium]